jgi:2-dehydro-3-deoxy-D-arabinonate dehydratase
VTLTRYSLGPTQRWALDGELLPAGITLELLLGLTKPEMHGVLAALPKEPFSGYQLRCPVEDGQEVWAAGVTYLRSRDERQAESASADVYGKVYEAERPELFFKTSGWRTRGHLEDIRIRRDSSWNVPEPELTLVVNLWGEIVGFTAGNDVSSRSIEGENPLYLPQAKSYDGSCAIGPAVVLCGSDALLDLPIECQVHRAGAEIFRGDTDTNQMKRSFDELVEHLFRETSFPHGVFLMTGTGIIPDASFTLLPGDWVTVRVGELSLVNGVQDR